MDFAEFLLKFWPLILGLLGLTVWLVRLEAKHQSNQELIIVCQKELQALTIKHETLDSKVVEQLAHVRESLARIEGKLGVTERR